MSLQIGRLSVDSLVFEAVQRCYRNSVVGIIRTRLTQALGNEWSDAVTKCFTIDEWQRIEQNAAISEAATGIERQSGDVADLLSVNHFYNIVDRYYELVVPENSRGNPDVDKQIKASLLKSIKNIKDARDPISHPPESDISPFDALNILYNINASLKKLGVLDDSVEKITSIRSELARRAANLDENFSSVRVLESALPPKEEIFDQFVGRTAELEDLWKWLTEPASGRWVLVGDGGKGKSAIAYHFADTVRRSGVTGLCGVFWMSAKKRRFEDGEIRTINSPDFSSLDSALNKLLNSYGYTDLSSKNTDYKKSEVLNLLKELPALVIVDDIDSIEMAEEDVVEFFTYEAPRSNSKILMTSRRLFQGMAKSSTVIRGMSLADAKVFLSGIAERMELEVPRINKYLTQIVEITDGSPLYMEDVMRLCRHLPIDKAVDKWKQHAGDGARKYALERELEMLTRPARNIIDACCIGKGGFTVAQLERITGHSEDDVIASLRELEKAYLVPSAILIDGEPTFTVNANLRWLVRRMVARSEERLGLKENVAAVVGSVPASRYAEVDGHIRQLRVLASSDREQEALAMAQAGLQDSKLRSSPLFLAAVGELHASVEPPRMADAREAWRAAARMGLANPDAFALWCIAEERRGNWHELREAAESALQNCERKRFLFYLFAGRASTRIGSIQRQAGNRTTEFHRAKEYLDRGMEDAFIGGASDQEISRLFKAMYMSERAASRLGGVAEVLKRWLIWNKSDPDAIESIEHFRAKYPTEAAQVLAAVKLNKRVHVEL